MPKLTGAYIDNRAGTIHTFDSFGRQVPSTVLSQAKDKLGAAEADDMHVTMGFRMAPSHSGCIYIYNGQWNVHVRPPGPVLE